MKKKFLSLMMAAAVVATTSVSAFAATANVTNPDTQDGSANVVITGEVENDEGQKPAGRFEVTVPTASAFTVDKDGNFTAADKITIKNDGSQSVDIYADEFIDTTASDGEGITVVAENQIKSKNRTYVNLNVSGTLGTAYLKSENITASNKGVYKNNTLSEAATDGVRLLNIQPGRSGDLNLNGSAGKVQLEDSSDVKTKGASNNFTLTLKIKKSEK